MNRLRNKPSTYVNQSVVSWLLVILIGIISFKIPSDPDLGWHLRNGVDTLANWATQTGDVYSWTMAGYPWVSHEWLTEIIMVGVNAVAGLWGLAIAFMVLVAATFWLASRVGRSTISNSLLTTIVGLTIAWPLIGARPQMITLLGVAGLLYVLFAWRKHRVQTYLYSIPFIFMLWANMHAGFAAGFLLVAAFIFGELARVLFVSKARFRAEQILSFKELIRLGLITYVGGGLATLVNPYGWGIHKEILNTLGQPEILAQIAEWMPIDFTSQGSFNLIIAGVLVLGLLAVTKFKVDYTKLLIAVVFFFFSLSSWRHLPLFAVACLPIISDQLNVISWSVYREISRSYISVVAIGMIVVVAGWWHIAASAPVISDSNRYAQTLAFPKGAVEYVKGHDLGDKMFNEYNWGGYLIWQLPEQKVFIDGRMAIWRQGDLRIFEEFSDILGSNRQVVIDGLAKWDVDFVLVGSSRPLNSILSLARDEWDLVYQDDISKVWARNYAPVDEIG